MLHFMQVAIHIWTVASLYKHIELDDVHTKYYCLFAPHNTKSLCRFLRVLLPVHSQLISLWAKSGGCIAVATVRNAQFSQKYVHCCAIVQSEKYVICKEDCAQCPVCGVWCVDCSLHCEMCTVECTLYSVWRICWALVGLPQQPERIIDALKSQMLKCRFTLEM